MRLLTLSSFITAFLLSFACNEGTEDKKEATSTPASTTEEPTDETGKINAVFCICCIRQVLISPDFYRLNYN